MYGYDIFMLPKQFWAYDGNDKKNYFMCNYIDLLVVDEAGQTSPEIAAASFSLAKKAVIVGDEEQIPPVSELQILILQWQSVMV